MLSRLALRNAQMLPVLAQRAQATTTTTMDRPKRLIDPAPTRLGIIPEEWFTFFYPKTGVTGSYMFGIGVTTYLVSKEIYILEHEYYAGLSLFIVLMGGYYKFYDQIHAMLDKKQQEEIDEHRSERELELKTLNDSIAHAERQKAITGVQTMISDVKKENIKIQLEAAYRERLSHVYTEVKKRLDYQLQLATTERKIAQKHMVQWIINNVMKAVTPDLEKSTLQQCIKDLQGLAPKA
ncbi:ATP synthase subunit b, mitochondrial [Leptopilina heterotoma]|uniref:ATP synthase subunit b, mitochondrial n=1 Tax=Leptopilina heterotoma TaxID=63436 RepID=UPI001CA9C06C|nr:ATP synthase subunit b, mitochondrial [Leptopilina heterotoma]